MKTIRPRKDGCGCSVCSASDDNVGKRRCVHTLDSIGIKLEKEGNTNFVNIEANINGEDHVLSTKAEQAKLVDYVKTLSKGLKRKEKEAVINLLREEDL